MKKIISTILSIVMFVGLALPGHAADDYNVTTTSLSENLTFTVLSNDGENIDFEITDFAQSSIMPRSSNGMIEETYDAKIAIPYATSHVEETSEIPDPYMHMSVKVRVGYNLTYDASGNKGYLINYVTVMFYDISGQANFKRGLLSVGCYSSNQNYSQSITNHVFTTPTYSYVTGFTSYAYENSWALARVGATGTGEIYMENPSTPWTVSVEWKKI